MYIQTSGSKKALWFEPLGGNIKGAVLFLTGFPKYPGNSKYVDLFTQKGYGVLCPMYSGTFESDGEFSIENSVEDANRWHDFLLEGYFDLTIGREDCIRHNINDVILCGVSYGGLVLSIFLDKYKISNTHKAFFISMLGYGFLNKKNDRFLEEADKNMRLLEIAFPMSYRFEDVDDFFNKIKGKSNIEFFLEKKLNNDIHKILIHGKDDEMTPINIPQYYITEHENSTLEVLDGGHSSQIDLMELKNILYHYLN